jgi:hypothetical protein
MFLLSLQKKVMTATVLYTKISSLPPSMIKQVDDFVEFLKSKQKKNKAKERKFGCAKGLIIMHDDFDAPLEDFKEYM